MTGPVAQPDPEGSPSPAPPHPPRPGSEWRRLRPLTLADLIEATIRVYARHPRRILTISAVLLLPSYLIAGIVSGSIQERLRPYLAGTSPGTPLALPPDIGSLALAAIGASVLVVAAAALCGAALAFDVGRLIAGEPSSARQALGAAVARGGSILAGIALAAAAVLGLVVLTTTLAALLIGSAGAGRGGVGAFLGLVVLVAATVAVVALVVRWSVWTQALMVERSGVRDAFRRSWRLTTGSTWRVFALLLLVVLSVVILGAIAAQTAVVAAAVEPGSAIVTQAIVTALIEVVLGPVVPIFLTLLYFDLRVRKEGFDVSPHGGQDDA